MKTSHENTTSTNSQVINIYVINSHNELLLHKQQTTVASNRYQWEIPSINYSINELSLESTIQDYIYQAVGVTCTLYEAFIRPVTQAQKSSDGRIIIAIINQDSSAPSLGSGQYIWIPINRILKDIHDNPSHYTQAVHNSIESVVLYLKDILKNQSNHYRNEQTKSI